MKKRALILCLFLCGLLISEHSKAQNALSLNFFKRLNSWPGAQGLVSMSAGSQGFIYAGIIDTIVTQVTGCDVLSDTHGLLILTDTDANVHWAHCYDGNGEFLFAGFDPHGEIWAAGEFDTFYQCSKLNKEAQGVTVVKLNSSGTPLWFNKYGNEYTYVNDFISTSDGGALILANFNYPGGDIDSIFGNNPLNNNGWLCKLDSSGAIQWNMILGGTGDQIPETIKETKPGVYTVFVNTTSIDYMLAGINFDSIEYVPWILQIDSGDKILSSRVVTGQVHGYWHDFTLQPNGFITLAGSLNPWPTDTTSNCGPQTLDDRFLVGEADTSYQFQWCALNGGSYWGNRLLYACTINDSLIVAGGISQTINGDLSACSAFSTADYHTWFGLYNLNLHKAVWSQALCGSSEDELYGLVYDSTKDALYVLIDGSSTDGNFTGLALPNSGNMYLLKYSPVTTGVETIMPNKLLFNVFPNPANDNVSVTLKEEEYKELNLKLFDITGQALATYNFGNNQFQIPVHNLASGMYMIEVTDKEGRSGVAKFVKQ